MDRQHQGGNRVPDTSALHAERFRQVLYNRDDRQGVLLLHLKPSRAAFDTRAGGLATDMRVCFG